jgi:two-component system KDP operon response regulator KdpE|tara:strand:+ start:262 stop:765 length:504 start_codon:yes stop_codon:yes gene_type:complete
VVQVVGTGAARAASVIAVWATRFQGCDCVGVIQMTAYMRPLVLMIEDDPDFLEITEMAVSQKGYRTVVAYSGKEGLQSFQTHNPDLVILDLGLPDMVGLDVLWWIRQISDCPVIVLTATDNVGMFIQAIELEVDDYLTKGVGLKDLVQRIELILDRSGALVRNDTSG